MAIAVTQRTVGRDTSPANPQSIPGGYAAEGELAVFSFALKGTTSVPTISSITLDGEAMSVEISEEITNWYDGICGIAVLKAPYELSGSIVVTTDQDFSIIGSQCRVTGFLDPGYVGQSYGTNAVTKTISFNAPVEGNSGVVIAAGHTQLDLLGAGGMGVGFITLSSSYKYFSMSQVVDYRMHYGSPRAVSYGSANTDARVVVTLEIVETTRTDFTPKVMKFN